MEIKSEGMRVLVSRWLILEEYYVAVTVHYINDEWKLQNFPIGFKMIVGPHTNEAVGALVAEVLKPFLGRHFLSSVRMFSYSHILRS